MDWFIQALKKYAVFSGRARRAEYWYFSLFYLLIFVLLVVADGITGSLDSQHGMGWLGAIFGMGMLLPTVAVSVRRLHDTDRSGWWMWLSVVPLVGLVLLVLLAQQGTPGDNRYGPSPLPEPD